MRFVPLHPSLFASLFVVGACVETPLPDVEPLARLVVVWDPLDCGEPHRVAVELEDERGAPLSRSVPCELGGMSIDVPHWGVYRGRLYAWDLVPSAQAEIRSVLSVRLEIDAPVVHWYVDAPR
jgi:hypothetical protein